MFLWHECKQCAGHTQKTESFPFIGSSKLHQTFRIFTKMSGKNWQTQVIASLGLDTGFHPSSEESKRREPTRVQSAEQLFLTVFLLSLSGCCYPGRRVLVHSKRPQFEITQPQEQVERRPWRKRRKGFKDVKAAAYTSANILQDNSESLPESDIFRRKGEAETDRWEGQPVDRPLQLQRYPHAPPAECSESGNRRWRSPLRCRYLREQQHYCHPWAIKTKISFMKQVQKMHSYKNV